MRLHMSVLAAAAALALSACASASPAASNESASRDCFRTASATGFGVIDDNHVRVSVGHNQHYSLTTVQSARQLDWSQAIAISGSDFVCTGATSAVYLSSGDSNQRYRVTSVERIPDDTPAGS
jgi:ABC-type Fe3+-hydroxamate transport system substrate-binding protein